MDEKQFKIICHKLDVLTTIVASQNMTDREDRIYMLKKAGMSSKEIAPLVGLAERGVRDTKGWRKK